MKFSDLFPGIDKYEKPKKPAMVIAERPPSKDEEVNHQWWYDRKNKIMYRATQDGYVKD